jgi:recA bacterial DNA recombination protein
MSSAVASTTAASGRLFVFDSEAVDSEAILKLRTASAASGLFRGNSARLPPGSITADPRLAGVVPASRLDVRPAPEMVSSGIHAMDVLTGGLPRGCLSEICGPASSGRTTLLLSVLAAATRRGESCAVVDANDSLDPQSAAAAGVLLEKLLWVRCGGNSPQSHPRAGLRARVTSSARIESRQRLEQVLRATDLLLDSGGFGLIVLDLGDLPAEAARYIPLTTWFRFRRTVEHTPTVLLAIEQQPIAGSCSSLLLKLEAADETVTESLTPDSALKLSGLTGHSMVDYSNPAHAQLLTGLPIRAELLCSRLERKPARSVTAFSSRTAWA